MTTIDTTEQLDQTQEEDKEDEDRGRHMLLNRVFKFIDTEEPLNDVLCGYFEKLVLSLRKRKE